MALHPCRVRARLIRVSIIRPTSYVPLSSPGNTILSFDGRQARDCLPAIERTGCVADASRWWSARGAIDRRRFRTVRLAAGSPLIARLGNEAGYQRIELWIAGAVACCAVGIEPKP